MLTRAASCLCPTTSASSARSTPRRLRTPEPPLTPPRRSVWRCSASDTSARLDQVAKEVWLCENKKVEVWKGDILEYKKKLNKDMERKLKEGLTTPQ
jgi:hypothetical protein